MILFLVPNQIVKADRKPRYDKNRVRHREGRALAAFEDGQNFISTRSKKRCIPYASSYFHIFLVITRLFFFSLDLRLFR